MRSSNKKILVPELLDSCENLNIEYIAMFSNEKYYIVVTDDSIVHIYSIHNFNQSFFEYHLHTKVQSNLFSLQTYDSNVVIFMFKDQFIVLQLKLNDIENVFRVQSEQIIPVQNRECQYSLELTPNKRYFILKQCYNAKNNPDLYSFYIFNCDNQFKITPIKDPITYVKSKVSTSGKIIAFMTYVSLYSRPVLMLTYQGGILQVRLPSHLAEVDIRSDYHSWMRHSLAIYAKTAEKYALTITITSLAVQSPNDLCMASGGDDGSIVLWQLTDRPSHEVLETIHTDKVIKHNYISLVKSAQEINLYFFFQKKTPENRCVRVFMRKSLYLSFFTKPSNLS